MKYPALKFIFTILFALMVNEYSFAQTSFLDNQKGNIKIAAVFSREENNLKKQFTAKSLTWPPAAIYIRSFKYDRQLEVWVREKNKADFKFFKSYKVCAQSGTYGPKRREGDLQVPEGFYYINEFNPNSNYHLSLGLNYPNASDMILSSADRKGGDIYIHGNCVSVGCIAIDDQPIEEVYILAGFAKAAGQDFIPVHVFPINYTEKRSMNYLGLAVKDDKIIKNFTANLKEVFDYFELKRQLPVIMVNKKGEYIIN